MRCNLAEADARLSAAMRMAENHQLIRTLAAFLAHSGDSWFWLAGLLLLWWFGTDYWKTRAIAYAIGVVATAVVVFAIKFVVRRRRPEGEWGQIYRQTDPHSFPSGHAARGMMLAVLALVLGPTWLGAVLLPWAFLVGLARVSLGVHYLSDVLAGVVIGVMMGWVVLAFYNF